MLIKFNKFAPPPLSSHPRVRFTRLAPSALGRGANRLLLALDPLGLGKSGGGAVYRFTERKSAGDTIVEVLIAIAVVSMVLGGAYVTTNRSLQATTAAQERGNALKLAETQLELIKGLSSSNPTSIFGGSLPQPFCVKDISVVTDDTDPACTMDTTGSPTTAQPAFRVSNTRAADGHTFTVLVTWENVSGRNTEELRLIYRVYEP